jgi:hypothetical protein
MKTIYLGHSRQTNFESEVYAPVEALCLDGVQLILPHRTSEFIDSKALFAGGGCHLFIAEVSYPSTGLGMELAYAGVFHVPTVCFHRSDIAPSSSVRSLGTRMVPYENSVDFGR